MRPRGVTRRQLLPRIEELARALRTTLAVLDELRATVTGIPRRPNQLPSPPLSPIPPLTTPPRPREDGSYALPFGSGSGSGSVSECEGVGGVGGYGGERNHIDRTRARTTTLPDPFPLTDRMRRFALEGGLDAELEFQKFKDSARAHGRRYTDWVAAWRCWCRLADEFRERRHRR
jgi:hypothetical protein